MASNQTGPQPSKITVHDIAGKAGVSQSTVSKVLNGYPNLRESTRKKVLQVIEEMGFVPDQIARSLVKNKTGTIGLIVGDIANPFFSETSKTIIAKARQYGIDVIISDTDYDNAIMQKSLSAMLARRVDGILVASVEREDPNIDRLMERKFPLILYNRKTDNERANYVVSNNSSGSRLAVEHLIELGHTKICFLSGSNKYSTFHQRYEGYKKTLEKHGIPFRPEFVYMQNNPETGLCGFIHDVLRLEDRPTAFFAATDQLAIQTMNLVSKMGYAVPEDFSIVGYDDIEISSNPFVGLTTVSQNNRLMAETALEKLLGLINGDISAEQPIQIVLESELIVRKTTSRARET